MSSGTMTGDAGSTFEPAGEIFISYPYSIARAMPTHTWSRLTYCIYKGLLDLCLMEIFGDYDKTMTIWHSSFLKNIITHWKYGRCRIKCQNDTSVPSWHCLFGKR